MLKPLLIAAGISLTGLARAAAPCDAPVTTIQMLECSQAEFEQADAGLNASYGKLAKLLDKEGKRKLKAAQRAWVGFRDANAAFSGDAYRGGSAAGLNVLGTRTSMTRARTAELDAAIKARQ